MISTWWSSLSWSHALLVVLLVFIAAGACTLWWRQRSQHRQRLQAVLVCASHRSQVVDYGAARAKAIEWLGDRYLLARPVNRRSTR